MLAADPQPSGAPPVSKKMVFVNFKARQSDPPDGSPGEFIGLRGFVKASDLKANLGRGRNLFTGEKRSQTTTYAATGEFDLGCRPGDIGGKNPEDARYRNPALAEKTSGDPPPGWPSGFPRWYVYEGVKGNEGYPQYANYYGWPAADKPGDEPHAINVGRTRELPILANTTGVHGGGIQRGLIPARKVIDTRWLGGFAEADPNAGCRPTMVDFPGPTKFAGPGEDYRSTTWYLVRAPGKLIGFVPVKTREPFPGDPTCTRYAPGP